MEFGKFIVRLVRVASFLKRLSGICPTNFDEYSTAPRMVFEVLCNIVDFVMQYNPDIIWLVMALHFFESIHCEAQNMGGIFKHLG